MRTGQQYLNGLRDSRQIWLAGDRVLDVTAHPALAGSVRSIAELYSMQHDSRSSDALTCVDEESGERVPVSLVIPRTRLDLARRREAYRAAAQATFGQVGRAPDYLNTVITTFSAAADLFGRVNPRFAENIRAYHRYCQTNDLFLAHATINPQSDRSRTSSEQQNIATHLRIVGETDNGLILNGAKMIGTLVPIADELIVFPLPRYQAGDEPYTAAFAIPVATDGLRIICREPFGYIGQRNPFDHPLARFDEIDAVVIFDNVKVPWERVFFYGDIDLANSLFDSTTARHHTGHQDVIRAGVKAELMVGVAIALAESSRTNAFLHVQEMLGEIIGLLELTRGAALLCEERASASPWGTITPRIDPIQALRYQFPRFCARFIEVIQVLGGGSLLATPTLSDLDNTELPGIERFFRTVGTESGRDRVHLLKLAWDLTGDSMGQRQLQYERYHAGDPVRLAALQYLSYNSEFLQDTVARALEFDPEDQNKGS